MADRFAYVNEPSLSLRSGPGTNYDRLCYVGKYRDVVVQAVADGWANVKVLEGDHAGKVGYMYLGGLTYK